MIRSAGPDPSPRDPDPSRGPDSSRGALIRPEGPGLPRGALLCRLSHGIWSVPRGPGSLPRIRQICPAGPVLGRVRALSAWAQSQGWHMGPLGPNLSSIGALGSRDP